MHIKTIECKDFGGYSVSEVRFIDNESNMLFALVGDADGMKFYQINDESGILFFEGTSINPPNHIEEYYSRKTAMESSYAEMIKVADSVYKMFMKY